MGRKGEVSHFHPRARWLAVALGSRSGPTAPAFTRAVEVMSDAGLDVVDPSDRGVAAGPGRFGLVPGRGVAEAK